MSARIVFSEPAMNGDGGRQLVELFLDEADIDGAIYHWVVDGDRAIPVVELANGAVITGDGTDYGPECFDPGLIRWTSAGRPFRLPADLCRVVRAAMRRHKGGRAP